MPVWAWLIPVVAAGLLGASFSLSLGAALIATCALVLVLALALAITIIEVALIISVMLAGGPDKATLPRDTIYAAVMIITTGVVGICILVGGLHHHEQSFRLEGANSALAALVALAGLSLVMPNFTASSPGGTYTVAQLGFVALSSLLVWGVFVFVQTVRHRDYFLPPTQAGNEDIHASPPPVLLAWTSIGLTIPVVVVASVMLDLPLELGLEAKDMVMLALAGLVSTITLATGRTNLMQGAVHLVLFAAFLFLALVP